MPEDFSTVEEVARHPSTEDSAGPGQAAKLADGVSMTTTPAASAGRKMGDNYGARCRRLPTTPTSRGLARTPARFPQFREVW